MPEEELPEEEEVDMAEAESAEGPDAWERSDSPEKSDDADMQFESTDEELSVDEGELRREVERKKGLRPQQTDSSEEESGEQVAAAAPGNEEARIRQLLSRLKLVKPDASRQRYDTLIYSNWMDARPGKKGARGPGTRLKQLFDESSEEEDADMIRNVDYYPPKTRFVYRTP